MPLSLLNGFSSSLHFLVLYTTVYHSMLILWLPFKLILKKGQDRQWNLLFIIYSPYVTYNWKAVELLSRNDCGLFKSDTFSFQLLRILAITLWHFVLVDKSKKILTWETICALSSNMEILNSLKLKNIYVNGISIVKQIIGLFFTWSCALLFLCYNI